MPHISIQQLCYNFPSGVNLFNNISLVINSKDKIAIIGDNGIGKTTLFNIIQNKLHASSGLIKTEGSIAIIPQVFNLTGTIAECLNISKKLEAINKVSNGEISKDCFEIIKNDWNIEERAKTELQKFNIDYLSLDQDSNNLSGGEKIKLLIIRAFLSSADFILMDEPTNNLDYESKQQLFSVIENLNCGVILISHDRELLNKMNKIAEMKSDNIRVFGGNYNEYISIKEKERENLEKEYSSLESKNNKSKKVIQDRQKDLSQQKKCITKKFNNNKYSPMGPSLRQRKEKAAKTTNKKDSLTLEKIEKNSNSMSNIRKKLIDDKIKIPLPDKPFLKRDLLLIKNLSFYYDKNKNLINKLSLHISGGEKIQVKGKNGSGKTTLIKLILGKLTPTQGNINLNGITIFLDQSLSILNKDTTLLENFLEINSKSTINEAHKILANFLFKNSQVEKPVKVLSGGELLKACLACILGTEEQPDLIILDEPTNNLDIKSIDILENVLSQYQGALIIVSHDDIFVKNIGIDKVVEL